MALIISRDDRDRFDFFDPSMESASGAAGSDTWMTEPETEMDVGI